MKLKNYTSEVPAERSISYIEMMLVNAGAVSINKVYEEQSVTGFTFQIKIKDSICLFKLPSREDQVFEVLKKSYKKWDDRINENCRKQARRTAWKLLYDWVSVQMSMIEIEQVEFMEVFLPYAFDGTKTLFESIKEKNYKGLLIQ